MTGDDRPVGGFAGGTFVQHPGWWRFDMTFGMLPTGDAASLPEPDGPAPFTRRGATWRVVETY